MLAELAGFIRVSGSISPQGGGRFRLRLSSDQPAVARHIKQLIETYFGIEADVEIGENDSRLRKGRLYVISIGPENLSEQILREVGILMIREGHDYFSDGIYDGVIRTKCCRKAYLRGLFLGAGTLMNPERGYMFEIVSSSQVLANDVRRLINSFVDLHARTIQRKKDCVTYVKDSGQILDILALMGASGKYFEFENVWLTREMRNEANRRSNCDQANIDKALAASEKHLRAIEKIRKEQGLDSLPRKLREMALLREEYPEATLSQLGEMMDPPLKKAGVNGRLKRIEAIAERLSG